MATKIKKPYNQGLNSGEKKKTENKDIPKSELPVAIDGVAAPIWRRIIAFIIDAIICFGATYIFLSATKEPDINQIYRWLYLVSVAFTAFWLFGMFPNEYAPGQTIGRKVMHIYTRKVEDSRALGMFKSFLREYVYGMIGMIVVVPFEAVSLVFQIVTKKVETTEKTLQCLPESNKHLILPRDTFFKTEVVYMPRKKKVKVQK